MSPVLCSSVDPASLGLEREVVTDWAKGQTDNLSYISALQFRVLRYFWENPRFCQKCHFLRQQETTSCLFLNFSPDEFIILSITKIFSSFMGCGPMLLKLYLCFKCGGSSAQSIRDSSRKSLPTEQFCIFINTRWWNCFFISLHSLPLIYLNLHLSENGQWNTDVLRGKMQSCLNHTLF